MSNPIVINPTLDPPMRDWNPLKRCRAIAALPELIDLSRVVVAWDDAREEGEPTDCEMLDDLTQRIEAVRRILARIDGGE